MNLEETVSREYLQSLPERQIQQQKQQVIQQLIRQSHQQIISNATRGVTSFVCDMVQVSNMTSQPAASPSKEEILEAFQKKYPDCKVYDGEMWIESRPGPKLQKKGIVIDWS